MKLEYWQLAQRQGHPLSIKERMSETRIRAWYEHFEGKVYVSFSGGKDSTVLLHLVRRFYPEVPGVFCDTGLEFPEIRDFVKSTPNIEWIKPAMSFPRVLETYGYPVVSKEVAQKVYEIRTTHSSKLKEKRLHGDEKGNGAIPKKWLPLIEAPFKISSSCCDVLKKRPFKLYEKSSGRVPFVGLMAGDSRLRTTSYLKYGCNAFSSPRPKSMPLAPWREEDVWAYLKLHKVPYSTIYDKGYPRTGCMFCMFGLHTTPKGEENRFELMAKTHPTQFGYCIHKLGIGRVLDYLDIPYPKEDL